jgi:hypothetical protein
LCPRRPGDELHVEDVDDALVGQAKQFLKARSCEPTAWKLDREEIDRTQLVAVRFWLGRRHAKLPLGSRPSPQAAAEPI